MRNNLKLITIPIVLQLLSVKANSQEILSTLFGQYKECYAVSSVNNEIKDGLYEVYRNEKLVIQGHYSNNRKSGLWTVYSSNQDKEFVYNYDLKSFENWEYQEPYQDYGDKKRPAYCVDGFQILNSRMWAYARYPQSAMLAGKQGSSTVTVVIDNDGQLCDFYLSKSSGYSDLDKEAVITVRNICSKSIWFPAVDKNDIPIDDKLKITINFMLNRH